MSARDSLEFDPSDFERPKGITRGTFKLPTCSVSVLLTENESGETVASVHAWDDARIPGRSEVFKAPTRKEAWAALSQWVSTFVVALLVFLGSSCGGPDVSCAGPLPVSCECATSCDFRADAGVVMPDVSQVVAGRCLPRCWRRDTGEAYP